MSCIPEPSKQAQEIIFSRETKKGNHSFLNFSNSAVTQTTHQKHFSVILDSSLTFDNHLNSILRKTNQTIGLLRKLQITLPRPALMAI